MLWLLLPVRLPEAGDQPSIADCLTLADSPSRDLQTLERCHAIVPADLELAADLGAAYDAAQRPDEAIRAYQRILDSDPYYAEVRRKLARLLQDRGDAAGAQAQIEAASRIQPNRQAPIDRQGGGKP